MTVRAQLGDIDRIGDALGVEPVVLKGAVAAVDGDEPVDLGDIDLLLTHPDFDALAGALVEEGFTRDAVIAVFEAPNHMPIDLHDALDVGFGLTSVGGTDSVRLPRYRRLRRLAPVAHAIYSMQHSTTHHVVRRGHLRDVVLLADALASCSASQRREIDEAVATSPAADIYRKSLAISTGIGDPFESIAAAKYAMAVRWPRGSGSLFPLRLHHVPFFVASTQDGWRIVRSYLAGDVPTRSRWYSTTVAQRAPRLAGWIAIAVRTPYRVVALAAAWAAALGIKRRYAQRWAR